MSNPLQSLNNWLDIRSGETRNVVFSLLGAFVILAFMVLGRSLREALYLTAFPVETLPYITAGVAALSLPAVVLFTRLLGRFRPRRVVIALALGTAGLLCVLWPFVIRYELATIAFYLVTAVGALLLTSGFWLVVAERFVVRRAKRLYGLIGAGGTAGALIMGASLYWLTGKITLSWLLPLLIALLLLFALLQGALSPGATGSATGIATKAGAENSAGAAAREETGRKQPSTRENLVQIWRSPHLRTIALIVLTATVASTLVDYRFKELARGAYDNQTDLTAFFGAFYGWAGGVALMIQLLIAGRIMASTGIAAGLAVLPVVLMLGAPGLLLLPGLVLATLVRGADYSLRKSMFRPLVELLYVPLPSLLRRRTKSFIDSVVDSAGEGLGALLVFCWVTLPGLPSRYLSIFVFVLAAVLLYLSRHMGRRYFDTIAARLREEAGDTDRAASSASARNLLSATFTRLNIQTVMAEAGLTAGVTAPDMADHQRTGPPAGPASPAAAGESNIMAQLRSASNHAVRAVLIEFGDWQDEHIPLLSRLLARDALYGQVVETLVGAGDLIVPQLAAMLCDNEADFVIRRRIPAVLARVGGSKADDALLDALTANRFEIRYRVAIALVRRRQRELPFAAGQWEARVWHAIRLEVTRDRPLWELQKLLDSFEAEKDDLVAQRVGVRGELSLEHTFRMLTLVLDPEQVKAAFQGIMLGNENLKSFALEYLEHVLPISIRQRLWLFIGDVSEHAQQRELRALNQVVSDLMSTRATLFAGDQARAALRKMLEENED